MTEPPADGPSLELGSPGWLDRLLRLYLEVYDPARSQAALAELPAEARDALADRLALRRLEPLGLRPRARHLSEALEARLTALELPAPDHRAVELLAVQWDVLMDVAALHERPGDLEQRRLELLTVMALGHDEVDTARELHEARLAALDGAAPSEKPARRLEERLDPGGGLPGSQTSVSIGIGLAYLRGRALARMAALYFERATVEDEDVARLRELSRDEVVQLTQVLLAVAWADDRIADEERALVEHQIHHAKLDRATAKRLRGFLHRRPDAAELDLRPVEPSVRRFILEQAALLSLVDDDQAESELSVVEEIAGRLGGTPEELERTLVEVAAFYERHRHAIRELGPVSGALGRLHRVVLDRAQRAVRNNLRAVTTEIRETGDLARLLSASSVRELTPDEAGRVRAQLLDICKTIPALAIFALPGGGMLLPVLYKLLPFDVLPSAFNADPAARADAAPDASDRDGDPGEDVAAP